VPVAVERSVTEVLIAVLLPDPEVEFCTTKTVLAPGRNWATRPVTVAVHFGAVSDEVLIAVIPMIGFWLVVPVAGARA
jgi:hypothetical protein